MMKAIGAHVAAAGAIVQGKVDYQSQLPERANAVQTLTRDISGLFPQDSDFGDTRAKDEVWSKRAEFEKRAKTVKLLAAAFAKTVKGGNAQAIAADFRRCISTPDRFNRSPIGPPRGTAAPIWRPPCPTAANATRRATRWAV